MELHQAIIKMEQGGSADGILQVNLTTQVIQVMGNFHEIMQL